MGELIFFQQYLRKPECFLRQVRVSSSKNKKKNKKRKESDLSRKFINVTIDTFFVFITHLTYQVDLHIT